MYNIRQLADNRNLTDDAYAIILKMKTNNFEGGNVDLSSELAPYFDTGVGMTGMKVGVARKNRSLVFSQTEGVVV